MPEGHTLLKLANDLDAAFAGRPVRVSSPQGRFAADAALLDGGEVVRADSAGKHLFVEFAGERYLHVHLGLIGKFDLYPGTPPAVTVGQVRVRLQNETGYADLRGATQCDLIGAEKRAAILDKLGADPLKPDPQAWDRAWTWISRSNRPIGDLLMDQGVVAGVGNVYRAEILFRHKIHPLRPGRTLRRPQFQRLWADLVELMEYGVLTGRIDTVRPEHTPEAMGRPPRKDDHGGEVYVYRRSGQECLVCGARVRTEILVGRNLFWCPRCQPVFRSRAVG
ncbi:Fpg/Nei family DNA glycosylase [Nocardioides marmoriginsengisoli]|uniref:DNA-(apurinic or apyrimidinic site) lyase n=1 Tax=Nocardioides marmoriginsengisoli TaxID=661483 RepID=A0A3N0CIE1_9ACTN|nr:DNA-formamidopyrimidine glycosylase family protein [Nocardioides marmoriginsengisoli]RNL63195.1 Fpg/Nei family DNA glycosylase [Nocardioides marmoriginsengisoli]